MFIDKNINDQIEVLMEEFKPEELLESVIGDMTIDSISKDFLVTKTVLGIDIYKYSQYPLAEQVFIPVLFEKLYENSIKNAIERESFFFSDYASNVDEFKEKFISTGDGGFQIFDNPLQAIIFSLFFQANIKRYCSGGNNKPFLQSLYRFIDKVDLRYAITVDDIYSYNSNFYGPAIINNARILSKDSLNRLLVDLNTIKWFDYNINAVENLVDLDKSTFIKTNFFKGYNESLKSLLFEKKGAFKSVDVLKIGKIQAKNSSLDIFNLHIQALIKLEIHKELHEYNNYVVTVGNLNLST